MKKKVIQTFPILCTILLETGKVSQIYKVWSEQTSKGQSIFGWFLVFIALVMWHLWYREITPEHKIPQYTTAIGVVLTIVMIYSVWRFS